MSEAWLQYMAELERRADEAPADIEAAPAKECKAKRAPEERREAKRAYRQEYYRKSKANETPEQREARLAYQREWKRKHRASK